jgi:hypothetical protein
MIALQAAKAGMDLADIGGVIFIMLILGGLLWSHLDQRKKGEVSSMPSGSNSNAQMIPILSGAVIGALAGIFMFWPQFFGGPLPLDEVMSIIEGRGEIFHDIITPWVIKIVICTVIGGVLGVCGWIGFGQRWDIGRLTNTKTGAHAAPLAGRKLFRKGPF